jgi:hypothetical protein
VTEEIGVDWRERVRLAERSWCHLPAYFQLQATRISLGMMRRKSTCRVRLAERKRLAIVSIAKRVLKVLPKFCRFSESLPQCAAESKMITLTEPLISAVAKKLDSNLQDPEFWVRISGVLVP